ncbi:hypothetical protein HK103_006715, partial [Boothiomyces macroporosus]
MNDILSGKHKEADLPKPKPVESKSLSIDQPPLIPSPAEEIKSEAKPVEKIKSVSNGKLDYAKWSEIKEDSPPPSPKIEPAKPKETKAPAKVESKGAHQKIVQAAVNKARLLGKEEFAKHNFESSLKYFTEAIETSKSPSIELVPKQNPNDPFKFLDSLLAPSPIPVDPVLYSNRALVYFKLGDFEKSLQDCADCIAHDPYNVKSLYRQSQCQRSLKLFPDCLLSLKECIRILEEKPELQKQVSLRVCKEQAREVQLLKVDQEIEMQEAGELLKDPSSELLGQLLKTYTENTHKNGKELDKITSNIIVMLKSHTSMKHAFRLLGGFQSLINYNSNIDERWIDILLEACVDCNENIREFGENLKRITLLMLANQSKQAVASKLFTFISQHQILVNEISRLKDFTKQLGELVKAGLSGTYSDSYLKFLLSVCKNSFELEERYQISAEWLLKHILDRSKSNPDGIVLELIFLLSKLENIKLKSVIYNLADEIILLIVSRVDKDRQTPGNIAIGLASIHNILFQTKRKHDKIFKTTKFMALLCRLLGRNDHHDLCLKIFNRLSHYNLNEINPYLIQLDWQRCRNVLEAGVDEGSKDLVGDWSQILAVFLKSSPANVQYFVKSGGLGVLTTLLAQCTKDQALYSRIIGNLALSLSVCAQN